MAFRNPFTGATWLYPFKGLYFFITHPFLYPLLRGRLLPIFFLSLFIYVNLFVWTYLPQVAFLAIFHRSGAFLNGSFLVLGEGAAITALLFEAFFVDETLVDVFDAVLIDRGHVDLVKQARLLNEDAPNPVKMLGNPTVSSVYSPFSLRQIIEFIVFLPFNLIPWVGVPIFLTVTGFRAGPLHHWRYFKLLNLSKNERKLYIKRRQLKYTWFGTTALLLQLVPGLSMFFLLTTAAGSALWVARMEDARKSRDAVERTEGRYQDDPA